MTRLSVNLNKVALLRNARHTGVPDLMHFARLSLDAGVQGLTVHPRPDERHIRTRDVYDIAALLRDHPHAEFNIEGRPDARLIEIVSDVRPHQVTLVPDAPDAFTSDKGWDLTGNEVAHLRPLVAALQESGARVILFVDPNPHIPARVPDTGADGIEIYTGTYAAAHRAGTPDSALRDLIATHDAAQELDLMVNAGHDLNLKNLPPLIRATRLHECSIGHELTADALELGWAACMKAYMGAMLR